MEKVTKDKLNKDNKDIPIHKDHRARMKEVFIKNGMDGFSEIQKLEFMLFFAIPQKDVNPLAHKLLDEFGTLNKVFEANYYDLIKVPGIGNQTALLITACREIMYQCANSINDHEDLTLTGDAREYCYYKLRNRSNEVFMVVCLDDCNRVLGSRQFSDEKSDRVKLDIRKITNFAFMLNASKILIAHNHPSGLLRFSGEDTHMTNNIACNCLLNDIELLDHILVTPTNALSLKDIKIMDGIIVNASNALNISLHTSNYYRTPNVEYRVGPPSNPTFRHITLGSNSDDNKQD